MISLATNRGRWARVDSGDGFRFEATRVGPDAVMMSTHPHGPVVTAEAATAMLRALAAVLGYEIVDAAADE